MKDFRQVGGPALVEYALILAGVVGQKQTWLPLLVTYSPGHFVKKHRFSNDHCEGARQCSTQSPAPTVPGTSKRYLGMPHLS